MRRVVLLTTLLGAAATSGCVTAVVGAAAGVGVLVAQERSLGEALDDGAAATAVRTRLLALDTQGFSDVSLEVVDGRLLLSGTVPTVEHRIDAERIAWSVDQVQAVANELEVGRATGVWRASMDELVTAQVRARLVASADVRAVDVNIETSRGTVYLLGLARNEEEIRRAAEIASITPGVQRVVSYMHLRPARERLGAPTPARAAMSGPPQALSGSGAAPITGVETASTLTAPTPLGAPLAMSAPSE